MRIKYNIICNFIVIIIALTSDKFSLLISVPFPEISLFPFVI